MSKRLAWFVLALVGVLAAAPAAWAHDNDYEIRVLSSPAEMVTGGDALVEVSVPRHQSLHVRIKLNGDDVTSAFDVDLVEAHAHGPRRRPRARREQAHGLRVPPSQVAQAGPAEGREPPDYRPDLLGPQQQPFVCKTQTQAGLGYPKVDSNQDGIRMRCSRSRATRRRR